MFATADLEHLCSRVVQCANATKTSMIIMQGTPGSGKTTVAVMLAKKHPNAVVVSADDFFVKSGAYSFDRSKLALAHESCKQKARDALLSKKAVIVDNCNATKLHSGLHDSREHVLGDPVHRAYEMFHSRSGRVGCVAFGTQCSSTRSQEVLLSN